VRLVRLGPEYAIAAASRSLGALDREPTLLVSEDDGATWTRIDLPDRPGSHALLDVAAAR
jgi:hypothetical protein